MADDDDVQFLSELLHAKTHTRSDEPAPTTAGISQCLQMLAQEAASLRLTRTLAALQRTISICEDEAPNACLIDTDFSACDRAPAGVLLH